MPTGSPHPIHIFLLGRFEVAHGERILRAAGWTRRKAAALFQRLVLERHLVKDQAIEFLWPEADLTLGANNLYRTLHALRQTLDTALGRGTADAIFAFEDGVLTLDQSVWVDAHEFEKQARAAISNLEPPNLQSAIDLYTGELLPDDLYSDWPQTPRESLRRLHRETSLILAAHHRDARDYTHAITLLNPLLARDAADEPVHRELMRTYALAGRRHEALRQYQTCVDALATELDVPPEPETAALYSQILSGELVSLPTSSTAPMLPAPIALELEHSPALIGRDAEFETLRAWMNIVQPGKGKTILLAGESGVGKTLLAGEALCAAAGAGMTPLFGAAYEQEGHLPYQPFIEAFDRYLTERQRPPEENPITHFKRLGSGDAQQEQWALFNAAATFLTDLARHMPVVLLVDDLHAADEASLHLFHYLARQTRTSPVILLATYRVDAVAETRLATLLNALYRERLSETLTLRPLVEQDVGQMLSQALDGEAAPGLVTAVHDIAAGNPFFVQEITRALIKADQMEKRDGQWVLRPGVELRVPTGLNGLVRERVTRLGPPVESALTAAAVVGREFGYAVLRGVTALSDGALLDALDAALAGHLLEETESGYRFRHPLIRRALYESLSRARRAQLHTRCLRDPDVFLPGDLVLRKALGGVTAREAAAAAQAWAPHRSLAVVHLWTHHALDPR
jgi:DNA-binding SARP family transcriptional activator